MEQGYFALKATRFIDLLVTSWNKLKLDNADAGTQGPGGICWSSIPIFSLLSLYTKAGWNICLVTICVSNQKDYSKQSP